MYFSSLLASRTLYLLLAKKIQLANGTNKVIVLGIIKASYLVRTGRYEFHHFIAHYLHTTSAFENSTTPFP